MCICVSVYLQRHLGYMRYLHAFANVEKCTRVKLVGGVQVHCTTIGVRSSINYVLCTHSVHR